MPPPETEQVVEIGCEEDKNALGASLGHEEEHGFGLPGDPAFENNIPATCMPTCDIWVEIPTLSSAS